MSKLKIVGNSEGLGTFTIISPNSDSNATIELPHSTGNLFTDSQHLIPSEDEVYDLGSPTKRWKDLNVSATTIFLGGQPIRATPTGISFPELSIGTGTNRIRLRASPFGKLKQISTDQCYAVAYTTRSIIQEEVQREINTVDVPVIDVTEEE